MADATRPRNLWEPLLSERAKTLLKKLETFMRDEVSSGVGVGAGAGAGVGVRVGAGVLPGMEQWERSRSKSTKEL